MLKTKQQVDKHVASIFNRVKDIKERHHKCYNLAKLYYSVKDYASAKKYLSMYMTVRDNYPPAHKLMGQIDEASGLKEKAVESYRRSFELDDKQHDVLLSICTLLCDLNVDPDRARFWYDKAEKMLPNNSVIFELKKTLCGAGDGAHNGELETLLTNELVRRPLDVQLRMQHIQLMLDQHRPQDAFDHIVGVQASGAFDANITWFEFLIKALMTCEDALGPSADYYELLLNVYNSLVMLSLQQRSHNECANTLLSMDKALQSAMDFNPKTEELSVLITEMQATVFYHCATILMKKANKHSSLWSEVTPYVAACYLVSYAQDAPVLQAEWHVGSSQAQKKKHNRWFTMANDRLCKSGYMVLSLSRGNPNKWLTEIKEQFCNKVAQSKLLDLLSASHSTDSGSFYLLTSPRYTSTSLQYPVRHQLSQYEKVAATHTPQSLHGLVWLALQHYSVKDDSQPGYGFEVFENLRFSVGTHDASVLCRIDVQAFLYATVRCTAVRLDEQRSNLPPVAAKPSLLPDVICEPLCTSEQQDWWAVAYRLHNSAVKENFAKARLTFQRGLECVRIMATHGMSVQLVTHLARTFEERANEVGSETESYYLRARAGLYWEKAKEMLEALSKKHPVRTPKEKLFTCNEEPLTDEEVHHLLNQARFFLACEAMKGERYEVARREFEQIDTAEALFNLSKIYRKLADEEVDGLGDYDLTARVRDRYRGLLVKAQETLHRTLDRMTGARGHKLTGLIDSELEEVETLIHKLDSDDMFSPADASTINHTGQPPNMVFSTPLKSNDFSQSPNQSTTHYRPSPERLHAQIRSMNLSQENVMRILLENNTLIKQMSDELRITNREVATLKAEIQKVGESTEKALSKPPPTPPAPQPPVFQPPNQYPYPYPAYPPYAYPQPPFPALPSGHHLPIQASMPHLTQQLTQPPSAQASFLPPSPLIAAKPVQASASDPTGAGIRSVADDYAGGHDYEDDLYAYDDEEDDDYPHHHLPDAQLVQQWPYGSTTTNEGAATISYSPQSQPATTRPLLQPGFLTNSSVRPVFNAPVPVQPLRPGFFFNTNESSSMPPNVVMNTPINSKKLLSPNKVNDGTTTFKLPVSVADTPPTETSTPSSFTKGRLPPLFDANSIVHLEAGPKTPKTPCSDQEYDTSNEGPHFEPIIPLPDTVEVKSGEEDEIVLFESRAKLYRWDDKEWKERGLGQVKVLLNETTGRARLLMRRDQILKLCLNSSVTAELNLVEGSQPGVTWIWYSMDFAEDEPRPEKFCIRFKTMDQARQFKTEVDKMVEKARQVSPRKPSEPVPDTTTVVAAESKPVDDLMSKFKPPADSWTCTGCYIVNAAEVAQCPACNTVKPGSTSAAPEAAAESKPVDDFMAKFKPPANSWTCDGCYIVNREEVTRCPACETVKPGSTPADSNTTSTTGAGAFSMNPGGGFTFGSSSVGGFSFKPPAQVSDDKSSEQAASISSAAGFSFGTPSSAAFTFGFAPTSATSSVFGSGLTVQNNSSTGTPIFGATASSSGFTFCPKPDSTTIAKEDTASAETSLDQFKPAECTSIFGKTTSSQGFTFSPKPDSTTNVKEDTASAVTSLDQFKPAEQPIGQVSFAPKGGFVFSGLSTVPASTPPVVESTSSQLTTTAAAISNSQTPISPPKFVPSGFNFSFTMGESSKASSADKPASTNVFSGFSFASKPDVSTTTVVEGDSEPKNEAPKPFAGFSLVSSSTTGTSGFSFSQPTIPTTVSAEVNNEDDEGPHETSYEADVHFTPIVELPEAVAVQSGEEEEVALFCERAKLFRYDSSAKQWKDRGIGEMKILTHTTKEQWRVLMRREQVLKVCANHLISADMKLGPMAGCDRAWSWFAIDFAEDSQREEMLACKFKTIEIADKFKMVFEECVEKVTCKGGARPKTTAGEATGVIDSGGVQDSEVASTEDGVVENIGVQDSEGSSTEDDEVIFVSERLPSSDKVELARKYLLPDTFYLYEEAPPCPGCRGCEDYVPEQSVPAVSDDDQVPELSATEPGADAEEPTASSIFANSAVAGISFSSVAATSGGESGFGSSHARKPFQWSGAGASLFTTNTVESEENSEDPSDHDPHYEPIISLPDQVEVKTGEEDDEILFRHRSKLFRYDSKVKQWKERGIGEMKILKNTKSGKYRLVHRREQVFKVVCNQNITADMELKPMATSETAWCWFGMDFSESGGGDEPAIEQFSIKFKTAELAKQFKDVFETCQKSLTE